jgi:hypothetical protein
MGGALRLRLNPSGLKDHDFRCKRLLLIHTTGVICFLRGGTKRLDTLMGI